MSIEITIMSVDLKPPFYYEVRKCVKDLPDRTKVLVEQGEDPIKKMFERIFPGWTLDFRGWLGDLANDAIAAVVCHTGDQTMRIECPQGGEQPNVLVTTYCPHFYF